MRAPSAWALFWETIAQGSDVEPAQAALEDLESWRPDEQGQGETCHMAQAAQEIVDLASR